jgi:serine/threonine-protein kinase
MSELSPEIAERLCPQCREVVPEAAGPRCPEHGLYALAPGVLSRLEDHPLLGQLLDEKYALVGVLGQGGTGSVYRALQEPLGRPVGVKLLHSAFLAAKDGRDRFEREARALASLSSLHTVRLLDYGITRQGPMALRNIAYLVMELLEGEDLQSRMVRGPMAPVDVLALLDALADSLDEAHAAGIVHRDLKPSNIVLTRRRDGREVPKLIDFGIARVEGSSHTEQGRVSGTPFYMAPEQARGDDTQGASADVYAAGALCYELLTGRVPFSGPSAAAVMMAHCQVDAPPLDAKGDRPDLACLEPVMRAALAKSPADRPASLGALRDAFAQALGVAGTGPTLAETNVRVAAVTVPPALEPIPEPPAAPTHRGLWIGLGIAAALALVGGLTFTLRSREPAPAAFGVVEPAAASGVVSAAAPMTSPPTAPPMPVTEAPLPVSTAASAAPAPRKPAPRAAGGELNLDLASGAKGRVAIPAGRWRVSVEVQGAGDGVTLAWEPAGCPAQRRASKSRYAETCTLPRPATLFVENPTALFGDACRVRVRWAGAE